MLVPLLALALMQGTTPTLYTGATLFASCKAAIRLQDDFDRATGNDARLAAACSSYLMGMAETGDITKMFCMGTVTPATLIRVYVAYMEKNPTLLDQPRRNGAALALADSYPCPAK
jgi:hypothetical protein